ncbi:MAG: hypothetical protein EHM59_08225 [Betaproteobacteria bacterium]|nr:MAG: hypothetical protein EHM59_08225 [Betaproteobacteria bacterium]
MDATSTPTFERVLSVFETAAPGKPFEPADLAMLARLQRAAREHYASKLDEMLAAEHPAEMPVALMRGAQMLHRRVANALGQAASRQIPRPQRVEDHAQIAELALGSLRARADEIKWHAFERTTMPRASWRQTNELVRAIESIGMERQPLGGGATCADAFAHCVLLASLNVGILSAPQVEIAHRWLCASATDMRVEPFFDPDAHWYQLDLARDSGPQRICRTNEPSATTRFFAVSSLGAKLADARTRLYAGHAAVAAAPSREVALHFGAFLDLAERLWSPDWRRASLRAERERAQGESIDVVIGLDDALRALGGDDDALAQSMQTWSLRDRSPSGLGAVVPSTSGANIPLGEIIAFRASNAEHWELACIVRRIRTTEDDSWSIGMRRLSTDPVTIELTACAAESPAPEPVAAIYATAGTDAGRIDGLVISASAFGAAAEFMLPTQGGAFRIRVNRVIDRGERWVRVGFEVLAKQAISAARVSAA